MADIIRPASGPPPDDEGEERWLPFEEVGRAAGYIVGLVREVTRGGRLIRVVVGREDGNRIQAVSVIPDKPENEGDALALALAALRTLELVASDQGMEPA